MTACGIIQVGKVIFTGERVTIELRVRLFTAKQSKIELGDRFLEFALLCALLSATIQKGEKQNCERI